LAGRKLPEVKPPLSGSGAAASSSSVRSTPLVTVEPPASDMTIAFWPPGPTSSMSMSSGNVCEIPLMLRFTSVIDAPRPESVQFDGYGVAGVGGDELSLMMIAPPHGGGGGGGAGGGGGGGGPMVPFSR
jgi:hypothetical protein